MAKLKCPEGVPDWILTYGDMMSLLLCFFIMLYAISSLEVVKIDAIVESLEAAFGVSGQSVEPRHLQSASNRQSVSQASHERRQLQKRGGQSATSPVGDQPNIVTVRTQGDAVKGSVIAFELDGDVLTDTEKEKVKSAAVLLDGSPYMIVLAGHASPRERGGVEASQNDLSFARAIAVRDALVACGIRRDILIIQVVGPNAPVSEAARPGGDPTIADAIVEILQLDGIPVPQQ